MLIASVYLCDLTKLSIPEGVNVALMSLTRNFQFMTLFLVAPEQSQRNDPLVEIASRQSEEVAVAIHRQDELPVIVVVDLVSCRDPILRASKAAGQQDAIAGRQ